MQAGVIQRLRRPLSKTGFARELTGYRECDGPEEVYTLVQVADKGTGRLRNSRAQGQFRLSFMIHPPPQTVQPGRQGRTYKVHTVVAT